MYLKKNSMANFITVIGKKCTVKISHFFNYEKLLMLARSKKDYFFLQKGTLTYLQDLPCVKANFSSLFEIRSRRSVMTPKIYDLYIIALNKYFLHQTSTIKLYVLLKNDNKVAVWLHETSASKLKFCRRFFSKYIYGSFRSALKPAFWGVI